MYEQAEEREKITITQNHPHKKLALRFQERAQTWKQKMYQGFHTFFRLREVSKPLLTR